MVTEKDGFIPKKVTSDHPVFLEYALSNLIWRNFKRALIRSSFNGNEDLVRLGIVKYTFGDANEALIRLTFISDGHEEIMLRLLQSSSPQRINTISKKINELLDEKIRDHDERKVLENLLRSCVLDSKNKLLQVPEIPSLAKEIMERNGLKYGDG